MALSNQDLIDAKIVVTGGTGFIGSRVVRKLIAEGVTPQNIRVIYYPGSNTTAVDDLPIDLYPLNILDKPALPKALEGFKFIFHLIGNTDLSGKKKKIQWLVNVEGTRNLLEACQNVEKVVYTSTVDTLGRAYPEGAFGDETTSPYASENPQIGKEVPKLHSFESPEEVLEFVDAVHDGTAPKKWWKKIDIGYFDSKLAAEELVNRFHREEGIPVVTVIPGLNFGPGDDGIGSGIYLLRIQSNSMPGYTKTGGFSCTHVDDQANGHYLAMLRGKLGERYVITGFQEDCLYMKDMLALIAEIVQEKEPNRKIKVPSIGIGYRTAWFVGLIFDFLSTFRKKPMPMGRASVRAGCFPSFFSYQKAERELGYTPTKTFRQAIAEMYDYFKLGDYFGMKHRIGLDSED